MTEWNLFIQLYVCVHHELHILELKGF